MRIVQDDLWLCADCLLVAVNGDDSSVPADRLDAVRNGVDRLGAHLVPDFDTETQDGVQEFARLTCAACEDWRAGSRHRFAILGE